MNANDRRTIGCKQSALYICYQSIDDPLTQTQVVAYLEGLAIDGYRLTLLTFEPRRLTTDETERWRTKLLALGVAWEWRKYHQRPILAATLWDIVVGIWFGLKCIRSQNVRLIHARSHVPGVMALFLKRLTRVRFLFDFRGLMAEENVDASRWSAGGLFFRIVKRAERCLLRNADGIVVITNPAEHFLRQAYAIETADKPIVVIPCCADLRLLPFSAFTSSSERDNTIVYVGKFGGENLTSETIDFMAFALKSLPNWRGEIWTQSSIESIELLLREKEVRDRVEIGRMPNSNLAERLVRCRVGLSLRIGGTSQKAASPTKVGEYLAAGMFVVYTPGIGDLDSLLARDDHGAPGAGIALELSHDGHIRCVQAIKEMSNDSNTPERCRRLAEKEFDLQRIGWDRYTKIYRVLLDASPECSRK